MKSLQQHIEEKLYLNKVQRKQYHQQVNEKLVINKDYVGELEYIACKPKNTGVCLMICMPKKENKYGERIDIGPLYYELSGTVVNISDSKYIKTKEGYYCNDHNMHWGTLLLFNEDAISFLKFLSEDPKRYINQLDLPNIEDFLDVKFKWPQHVKHMNGEEFYDKNQIQNMINRIK